MVVAVVTVVEQWAQGLEDCNEALRAGAGWIRCGVFFLRGCQGLMTPQRAGYREGVSAWK